MNDEQSVLAVLAACDRVGIDSFDLRAEMIGDPDRALRILHVAERTRGVRNPAAFATARWRATGGEPARLPSGEPADDVVEAPPSLADLERAWAIEPQDSPAVRALLKLMAAAIARHGGFYGVQARASFLRDRYGETADP